MNDVDWVNRIFDNSTAAEVTTIQWSVKDFGNQHIVFCRARQAGNNNPIVDDHTDHCFGLDHIGRVHKDTDNNGHENGGKFHHFDNWLENGKMNKVFVCGGLLKSMRIYFE